MINIKGDFEMKKIKLLIIGLSLFSAFVFTRTATAQETMIERDALHPSTRITTDVKMVTLENGESYNLKKSLFKDKKHSTLLAFQVKTQEDTTEAVVKTIRYDDGQDFVPPYVGTVGYVSSQFLKNLDPKHRLGFNTINISLTNMSGGTVTYRVAYNSKVVENTSITGDTNDDYLDIMTWNPYFNFE